MKKKVKASANTGGDAPRVIIYARTSSDSERTEDGDRSLPEQVADCEAVAEREGWKVVSVVQEPNRSSWTYPTGADEIARLDGAFQRERKTHPGVKPYRDGMGKVISAMRDGAVDVVLVRDMTRWLRPLNDGFLAGWSRQQFGNYGVKLWSVQEGEIDFDDFGKALATDVMGRVLAEERKERLKKAAQKMAELRNAGRVWRKMTCYGIDSDRKKGLVVDEPRAKVVREIYARLIEGETYHGIMRDLARRGGVPRSIGGGLWSERQIREIGRNPLYCGYMTNTSGILIQCAAFDHTGKNPSLPKPILSRATWE